MRFELFGVLRRHGGFGRGRLLSVRRIRIKVYLLAEIFRREREHARREHDGEFGNEEHALINERIEVFVGERGHIVAFRELRAVHAEREHPRKIMRHESERASYARAEHELRAHSALEQSEIANTRPCRVGATA